MRSPTDRGPVWDGEFYPSDPHDLEAVVRRDLDEAAAAVLPAGRVKALVSPHAGYRYSGPVAGSAWAVAGARRGEFERVVLLGPSHRLPTDGIVASGAETWSSPLGELPVDTITRDHLVRSGFARIDDLVHAEEHAIEVQLPFLQVALGSIPVLPLLVGRSDPLTTATVLDEVWDGPGTLVVVSSDLSHYHDHATASHLDAQTAALIVAGRARELLTERACGAVALRGLVVAAREHGLHTATLDLRTSGDTSGDRSRVVGYGAFACTDVRASADRDTQVGIELVRRARRAIRHAFVHQRRVTPTWDLTDRRLTEPSAAFVSLHVRGTLRGCIGTLHASEPLTVAVERAAVGAAFNDERFAPLTSAEYLDCDVSVSVLSEPRRLPVVSWATACESVHPGDGVTVHTPDTTATLLPAVWAQIPSVDAFLDALWEKAGLAPREWPLQTSLEVYSTQEFAG